VNEPKLIEVFRNEMKSSSVEPSHEKPQPYALVRALHKVSRFRQIEIV
jgi:hypothetical protein